MFTFCAFYQLVTTVDNSQLLFLPFLQLIRHSFQLSDWSGFTNKIFETVIEMSTARWSFDITYVHPGIRF
jgi:hypothetical protein